MKNVASMLMSIDEEYLSTWLIKNYAGQCAQLCPVYILRLFDDVSSSLKLQNAVSEIVCWRLNTSLHHLWHTFLRCEHMIIYEVSERCSTSRAAVNVMNEFTKIDKRLSVYFSALVQLHVACRINRNGRSDSSLRTTELNASEQVELLQKSAVEHMTTYRQLMAQDFGSVATIATTDFVALYAYKRGDYQRCLQLSTQNVHTQLYAVHVPDILIYSNVIQLLDDDIVSLTALTLIVNPKCRSSYLTNNVCINQVTLSLYLMTQCQLKLHHSVTSLAQTLSFIKVIQRRYPRERTLDHLTLKLIEHNNKLAIKLTARKVDVSQCAINVLRKVC